MGKIKEDNMTLGTLLLGLAAFILIVWLLKIVLIVILNIAESVLTVGFYAVLIYAAAALILSLYAALLPEKTPKIVKGALALNHAIAKIVKYLFRMIFHSSKKKNRKPDRLD